MINKRKYIAFAAIITSIVFCASLQAQTKQGVAISPDNNPPHDGARLDVQSDSSGVLIPRMNHSQMNAITPLDDQADGMQVYVNNGASKKGFWFYDGKENKWVRFGIDIDKLVPLGIVMPFNSNTCPTGWVDFQDGQGRFIVGVGSADGNTYSNGDKGGEAKVTLQKENLPAHMHKIVGVMNSSNGGVQTTTDQHTHDIYTRDKTGTVSQHQTVSHGRGKKRQLIDWESIKEEEDPHTHGISGSIIGNSNDGNGLADKSHENRPPYIVLKLCKRAF